MPIFICEDDVRQREQLREIVENYIMIEALDMQLALTTADPCELVERLAEAPGRAGIYLLDIDLNHELNGIELAAKIREFDALGKIIFVTTHAELAPVTFRYKVEAYDYIVKSGFEDVKRQIIACLKSIVERQTVSAEAKAQFVFKSGAKSRAVNQQDILFFETLPRPHVLALHTPQAQYQFYGRLKDISQTLPGLVRVHKSILANLEAVVTIDAERYLLEFAGGQTCPVAISKLRQVQNLWQTQKRRRLS